MFSIALATRRPALHEVPGRYALTSGHACSYSGRQAPPRGVVAISLHRSHSCRLSDGFSTSNK